MATKHPRLNVVLEQPLYGKIKEMAKSAGVSLSLMTRDLLKEAVDSYEDIHWVKVAETREKSYGMKKAKTHEDIWS